MRTIEFQSALAMWYFDLPLAANRGSLRFKGAAIKWFAGRIQNSSHRQPLRTAIFGILVFLFVSMEQTFARILEFIHKSRLMRRLLFENKSMPHSAIGAVLASFGLPIALRHA